MMFDAIVLIGLAAGAVTLVFAELMMSSLSHQGIRSYEAQRAREAEAQRFHALERAAAVSIDDVIESAERRAEHPEWSWGWVNGLLVRHHHSGFLRDDPEPKSAANCYAADCPEKVR